MEAAGIPEVFGDWSGGACRGPSEWRLQVYQRCVVTGGACRGPSVYRGCRYTSHRKLLIVGPWDLVMTLCEGQQALWSFFQGNICILELAGLGSCLLFLVPGLVSGFCTDCGLPVGPWLVFLSLPLWVRHRRSSPVADDTGVVH